MSKKNSIIFIVIAFTLFALILLIIGGSIAGWDILGALTSKTAILIYLVMLILAFNVLFILWKVKKDE